MFGVGATHLSVGETGPGLWDARRPPSNTYALGCSESETELMQ